jgi:pSer/pThr/pTyr-binding forkhead associated (FHA) protein
MKIELTSTDSRRKFVVDQFPVIVGLDPGADICLDDSAVGHYQCMIDNGDEVLMVWDLGTQAGTLINGQRVKSKAPLLPGDELTIGRSTFVVHYDHNGQKSQRPVAPPPKPESRPAHPAAPRRREPAIS